MKQKQKRKYRLNRDKFTEFLAGIASACIVGGIWMAILLNL